MPNWLSRTFDTVYPCDGHDPIHKKINGSYITADGRQYIESPLTRVTSFFGIANRRRHDKKASIANIFLNLFFIPESDAPMWQYVLQFIAAVTLIPFAFNFLSAIGSTLIHTAMLVTEFAPLALTNLCKEKNLPPLAEIFNMLHFIGRATTSPITSLRDIYNKHYGSSFVLLAAASVIISTIAIAYLLPSAIFFVATSILPVVAPTIAQAALALINAFTCVCEVVSATVDIALLTAIFTASFGPLINSGINSLLNKFFNNAEPSKTTLRASQSGFKYDDIKKGFDEHPLPPSHVHTAEASGVLQPPDSQPQAPMTGVTEYPGAGTVYVQPAPLPQQPAGGDSLQPIYIPNK